MLKAYSNYKERIDKRSEYEEFRIMMIILSSQTLNKITSTLELLYEEILVDLLSLGV